MAPKYKLIYFNTRGRAEMIRIMFAAAEQDFIDERIDRPKLEEIKDTLPFGQLPVLEVDGEIFAQSVAIANYVARELGFYGKTNKDAIQIDQVMEHLQDVTPHLMKLYFIKDADEKAQFVKTLKEETVHKFWKALERLIKKNKTGFFVGSEITLADIGVLCMSELLVDMNVLDLNEFPEIIANGEKVKSHPKIAQYLKVRK